MKKNTFLSQNEIRRAKKALQKKAAQKRTAKNGFKKVETVKRVYNEIPYNVIDIYTFGYMSDSESIWEQYNNIGFGGKLILKTEDNTEYIITKYCRGFSCIEILIFDLIEDVPVAWKDKWFDLSKEEKEKYRARYKSGNYISNHYALNDSKYQYGIEENEVFWKIKNQTNIFKAGHMYTWEKDLMIMYYEIFISSSDKINEEEINEWFEITAEKQYNYRYVNPKGLALLYITLKKIGYEQHNQFFASNKKLVKITCEILTHVINEDIISFVYDIINGSITEFNIKILYKYLEDYLYKLKRNKLSLQGMIEIIKHSKWVYTVKQSDFRNNIMDSKDCYFSPSKKFKCLKETFELKFGRIPKIIDVIHCFAANNNIEITEIVNKFNVKFVGRLLKTHNAYNALCVMYLFPELEGVSDSVLQYLRRATDNVIAWVVAHKKSNDDFLIEIIKNFDYLSTRVDLTSASVREIKKALVEYKGSMELERIRRIYKYRTLYSSIQFCEVYNGEQKAFVLDANSPLQAVLGYETHCCQHLGGAGESAMMYGLLAPNAGFWAIEEKEKIVAQAEIWTGLLDGKEVLVFDNIELANDRDFNLVRKTLEKWLESSSYKNIIMGTGHNVLSHGYDFVKEDLVQPKCDLVPNPYTDAKECVWLKRGGEVQYVKENKKDE